MDDDIKCLNNRQSSKPEFVDHQFLLCRGLKHTEKHTKNAYNSIGYKNICDMAKEPGSLDKDKSFATILSTYRSYDGRDGDVQREHGKIGGMVVDIDEGNKDCEAVKAALKPIIGNVDYLIYSTSTAKVDDQKWRAIIPFADLHPYSEIEFVTKALFNRLDEELGGAVCDRSMESSCQVSFLPNVPYTHTAKGVTTKYRDENGKALFYQYLESDVGERFDPRNCSLTSLAQKLKDEAALRVQASLEERATRQAKALESPGAAPGGSVIHQFNQHYKVADLLVEYGYKEMNGRYLSPKQESGIPGTVIIDNGLTCFIHSQTDIDLGIGKSNAGNSCNYADAFDLFTHYEHQGDQRAAVKAAAELLGMNRSSAAYDFSLRSDPQTGEVLEVDGVLRQSYESPLAKTWVFVTNGDIWFNTVTGQTMSIKAFNLAFKRCSPPVMMTPNGQPTGKKSITNEASVYLISYCGARVVSDLLYMPFMDSIFELDGLEYANSYMKSKLPKADENWSQALAPKLIEQHLGKMFANEHEIKFFIKWMAWLVQNPGKKVRWLPLIIGAQGDAKSQLGAVIGLAMGSSNVKVVSQQELHENFTGWKYGACLAVLEELKAVGKSRHDVSEKLKEPVTNNVISVLRKGRDGFNAPNTQNYLALTNHRDAVIIEQDDRRWFVMETVFSQQRKSPLEVFDAKYWDDYFQALEHENGSIRGWLLSIDTSDFDPNRAPPSSAAKEFMKSRSKSSDAGDIIELLELGEGFGYTTNVVATDCISDDCFRTFGYKVQSSRLANALAELGFNKFEKVIKWRGKSRRVYIKPNFLDGCLGEDSKNIRIRKELDQTESILNTRVIGEFSRESPYEHDHFK